MTTTAARTVHGRPHRPDLDNRPKKFSSVFGILSLAGHNSFGSTRNAFARQIISKSDTHLTCVPVLAETNY
jgi:hypothetical protein